MTCKHGPQAFCEDCLAKQDAWVAPVKEANRGDVYVDAPASELSPCPPCPNCNHEHRFGGCALCACWTDKPMSTWERRTFEFHQEKLAKLEAQVVALTEERDDLRDARVNLHERIKKLEQPAPDYVNVKCGDPNCGYWTHHPLGVALPAQKECKHVFRRVYDRDGLECACGVFVSGEALRGSSVMQSPHNMKLADDCGNLLHENSKLKIENSDLRRRLERVEGMKR